MDNDNFGQCKNPECGRLIELIQILSADPEHRDVYLIESQHVGSGAQYTFSTPGNLKQTRYTQDEIDCLVYHGYLESKWPDEPEVSDQVFIITEMAKNSFPVCCEDCGLPYERFGFDTRLPNYQWKRIIKRNDGGGILCANCIIQRGVKTFPRATIVLLQFK